jgi:hypothetical protein
LTTCFGVPVLSALGNPACAHSRWEPKRAPEAPHESRAAAPHPDRDGADEYLDPEAAKYMPMVA